MIDVFTEGIRANIDREIPDDVGQYLEKLKRLCLAAIALLTDCENVWLRFFKGSW